YKFNDNSRKIDMFTLNIFEQVFHIMNKFIAFLLVILLPISVLGQNTQLFYESGRLKGEGAIQAGMKTGPWKEYYEKGSLMQEGTYENDKKTGVWNEYYENGILKSTIDYNKGSVVIYSTKNKVKFTGNLKNEKPEGTWKEFH